MTVTLEIRHIVNANPSWARSQLGPLEDLRESVKQHGVQVPLLVLPDFLMVDGARRLVVAKELGMAYVPVRIVRSWNDVMKYFRPIEADCLPMDWPDLISFWYVVLNEINKKHRQGVALKTRRSGLQPIKKPVYSAFIKDVAALYGCDATHVKTLRDYVRRIQTHSDTYPYFVGTVMATLPTGEAARDLTKTRILKTAFENLVSGRMTEREAVDVFHRRLGGERAKLPYREPKRPDQTTRTTSFDQITTFTEMVEGLATEANGLHNFKLESADIDKIVMRLKSAITIINRMRRRLEAVNQNGEGK